MEKKYYSTKDICEYLGVERRSVYRYINDGMPCNKTGSNNSKLLFDLDEVKAWVKAKK